MVLLLYTGNGDGSFTPFKDDYFNDIPYGTNVGKRGAYAYDISHFTILSANGKIIH